MAQQEISSTGLVSATAEQVWLLVGDFLATWHPAIDSMTLEHDDNARVIRAFTLKGEDTTYRERLTWHSNSERSFAYTHVEGIDGVQAYNAQLKVTESNSGQCSVTMAANLVAEEPRAEQIASGTKAIFDDAIGTIQKLAASLPPVELSDENLDSNVSNRKNNSPTIHLLNKIIQGSPTLSVSYIESPTTSDTLCLFLHGIGGNRSNWDAQLVATSEYCTSASLDLRGYGDSQLGDSQTTVDDYCDDILRVIDSFNAKRLILCGLSYGAWIATSFAHRYPERLVGLVLSGGCTGMSEASSKEREAFRLSREVPMNEGKTPADFAPNVVEILAGPDITEHVKQQLLDSMSTIASETYLDALRCFTNPREQFDFTQITMPVLLMTGDADKLAPPSEIKQVAERIHRASTMSDVRYECLKRTGHLCNLESADAYNAALIELVNRVK